MAYNLMLGIPRKCRLPDIYAPRLLNPVRIHQTAKPAKTEATSSWPGAAAEHGDREQHNTTLAA